MLRPESPFLSGVIAGIARLFSLAAGVLLTRAAVTALPRHPLWRWSFWTLTVAGWLAVAILTEGRLESRTHRDDHQVLQLALAGAGLAILWLAVRTRQLPSWRTLRDAGIGAAVVALVGVGVYATYESNTRALRRQAEARWAELKLPITDFEKSLTPVAENAGSQVVREVYRDLLNLHFYKEGTRAADQEPPLAKSQASWDLVTKACDIISAKLPPTDDLDLSKLPVAALEPHAAQLDAAYRRILAAEPALWAWNPADGYDLSVPNFLATRMFGQLAGAESLRCLAAGDVEGARRAVAACHRLGEGLEQNPALVSLMIHVAVEALIAPRHARLPVSDDSLDAIARDTAKWQTALVRRMQWETAILLGDLGRVSSENMSSNVHGPDVEDGYFLYLPRWIRPVVDLPYMRREGARAALNNAEHAAIRISPATLTLPDFGADHDDAISRRSPSSYDIISTRAAMRIYATLLLREQAELIRDARARLAAGRPVESRASVVLPALRWELKADPVKATVSTCLVNAPLWITRGDVTGNGGDFWVLPIDGTVAWQFRLPATGTAAR